MSRIGILVVDDHPLFRRGIRMGLEGERELFVVADAADGPTALQAADQFAPDVVLLDVSLPTMSGFDVARAIKRRHPRTVVVILTMHDTPRLRRELLGSGASAFLAKSDSLAEIVAAVKGVNPHP